MDNVPFIPKPEIVVTVQDKLGDFIPKTIVTSYGIYGMVLIELDICSRCRKTMVQPPNDGYNPFPNGDLNFSRQLEKSGWVKKSNERDGVGFLCEYCATARDIDHPIYEDIRHITESLLERLSAQK